MSASPSKAATPKEYARFQQSSKTAIYDGFYAHNWGEHPTVVTVAPPVEIFHPVFQQFLDRIDDPTFKPAPDVIPVVSQLMSATMEIHSSEDAAFAKLRPLLSDLLGTCVGQIASTKSRTPDGVVLEILGNRTFPFVCIGYSRAFCDGGRDPSTQVSDYLRKFLVKDQVCGSGVCLCRY